MLSKNSPILYRQPAYLICTNPHASLEHVLQAYLWRWDIEVNFRDEKTLLGPGTGTGPTRKLRPNPPPLAVAAYATLPTVAAEKFGARGIPQLLPLPKCKNLKPSRATTQCLINHLRAELRNRAILSSGFVYNPPCHTKHLKSPLPLSSALFYGAGRN